MKKAGIILSIILTGVLVLAGCGKKESSQTETTPAETTSEVITETTTPETQKIENEKPVYLYYMDYASDTAERVSTFSAEWSVDEDLGVFAALAKDGESFDFIDEYGSEILMQQEIWDSVSTSDDYKIGYEISFDVNGESRTYTILEPADVTENDDLFMGDYDEDEVTGYIGIWLYDDYHQDGSFYDHVDVDEYDDDTLLTSIKLRPTPDSSEIDNLVLKAFSYSNRLEFDSDGNYNNSYESVLRIERE